MAVVNKVTWCVGLCAGVAALAAIGVAEPRQILRVVNHLFRLRAAVTSLFPFRGFRVYIKSNKSIFYSIFVRRKIFLCKQNEVEL